MLIALVVYSVLWARGRAPKVENAKHNELLGPFMGRYMVWLISPIERALVGRVSPNVVTAMSLACCAATGVVAAVGSLGSAVWLYAFGGILDILDGRLARISHQQTKTGALFDSVSDRWAELFVFTGYAWYLHDTPWLFAVLAAMGASQMVSYTRARAEALGVELQGGMMQRAERILLVTLGTLAAACFVEHAVAILGTVMTVCAVSATGTAMSRWIVATRALRVEPVREAELKSRPAMPSFAPPPVVAAKLRESAELG